MCVRSRGVDLRDCDQQARPSTSFVDNTIGVTSYGALGHVPPLELGHVKKIWQFLR